MVDEIRGKMNAFLKNIQIYSKIFIFAALADSTWEKVQIIEDVVRHANVRCGENAGTYTSGIYVRFFVMKISNS